MVTEPSVILEKHKKRHTAQFRTTRVLASLTEVLTTFRVLGERSGGGGDMGRPCVPLDSH